MSYTKWQKRLEIAEKFPTVAKRREAIAALKINNMQPDHEDEGYYRKPVTEPKLGPDGKTNGQKTIIDWIPVAYYMHNGQLTGVIGNLEQSRLMTDREIADQELWTWVVANPISYDDYVAVAERGEQWFDMTNPPNPTAAKIIDRLVADGITPVTTAAELEAAKNVEVVIPAANREVGRSDNAPPEEAIALDVEHATAIDNAIGAAKDLPVTTVPEAEIASGAANIIRERRLAAEKVAKRMVEPLKIAYDDERGKWAPPVLRAKAAEDDIRLKVSNFEIAERKRIAAEQLAALEKQREIDDANQRAADRAIAEGQPEPPPVVEEVVIPQAPEKTKPTYGSYTPRAKPVLKFAVIQDAAAVLNHFKLNYKVIELIQKLATDDIRTGLEVPGATFREGTE